MLQKSVLKGFFGFSNIDVCYEFYFKIIYIFLEEKYLIAIPLSSSRPAMQCFLFFSTLSTFRTSGITLHCVVYSFSTAQGLQFITGFLVRSLAGRRLVTLHFAPSLPSPFVLGPSGYISMIRCSF